MKTMLDRARHLAPPARPGGSRPVTARVMTAANDGPSQVDGAEVVFHEQITLYPTGLGAPSARSAGR